MPRSFHVFIPILILGVMMASCSFEEEPQVDYTAGKRWIMPKYGCDYLDVNREWLKRALDEVVRLNPQIQLGGKPLGDVVLILKGIKDTAGEVVFAIEMGLRVLSLEAVCFPRRL